MYIYSRPISNSKYVHVSVGGKYSSDLKNEGIEFKVGRNTESSCLQVVVENGTNRSKGITTIQNNLRPSLFSKIKTKLPSSSLLITNNRYNDKNLHLYSVATPAASV